jgi:hypothetical protein
MGFAGKMKKSKDIDISTQQGLDDLKEKAIYYGYYAENLKVPELIEEIETLRNRDWPETLEELETAAHEAAKKLGW